jgi:anti-sigma B factor antagonist
MKATVRRFGDVSVVDLCGKLVIGTNVNALREKALRLLESGRRLILLNLEHVPYLDASGIGELVACSAQVRSRGGALKLLKPSTKVRDLLELSHLEDAFEAYQDEARARASF